MLGFKVVIPLPFFQSVVCTCYQLLLSPVARLIFPASHYTNRSPRTTVLHRCTTPKKPSTTTTSGCCASLPTCTNQTICDIVFQSFAFLSNGVRKKWQTILQSLYRCPLSQLCVPILCVFTFKSYFSNTYEVFCFALLFYMLKRRERSIFSS